MSSGGAVKTAASGRGTSGFENADEYKIILPQLPTGYVVTNAVFLHCDVKGRPYRIQDFRLELQRLDLLKDLASAGPHQMNHVWLLRMQSPAAKQRLVEAQELKIKGGRCLVIDPANTAVKLKLHWVPYDVPNGRVKKELERYGEVSEVARDFFREKGFEAVESNTRSVRLTLKEGYTVDSLPHEMRLEGCKVLVVVPGRAPLCLRCRRTGHIRRDCRVPRCSDCHRYGHDAADCVKTYASIARDRKLDDNSEYLMDGVEAEEAVGGSPPTALQPAEQCEMSATKDDGNPDITSPERNSEAPTEGPATPGAAATKHLPEEQARLEGGPSAASSGLPIVENNDAVVVDGQDNAMDFTQTVKRPREPVAAPASTCGPNPYTVPVPGSKKSKVAVKPRVPPDDRRRKDSL
ncbi:hypothetical protein ISCGN_006257, partial [Ixodes scapularis]